VARTAKRISDRALSLHRLPACRPVVCTLREGPSACRCRKVDRGVSDDSGYWVLLLFNGGLRPLTQSRGSTLRPYRMKVPREPKVGCCSPTMTSVVRQIESSGLAPRAGWTPAKGPLCPNGGIGRRAGLKIRSSKEGVGSSPTLGTTMWADSSVGRAAALQAAGRRFEPCSAYHLDRIPACRPVACTFEGRPSVSCRCHAQIGATPTSQTSSRRGCTEWPTVREGYLRTGSFCGSSSIGRASAFQADCCGFDPRLPLSFSGFPCRGHDRNGYVR
jgi:hypothetical protein